MSDMSVIDLPERLDISCVEALHLELDDALNSGNNITLNGEKVTKLDTAGLQVIKAFINASQEQHIDLEWSKPSSSLIEVSGFLNIGSALGLKD